MYYVKDKEMGQPAVRTKYDRMFGRKNQNVLSEHYHAVVDHTGHSDSSGEEDDRQPSDEEEDFITLARADHDLDLIDPSSSSAPTKKDKKAINIPTIPGIPFALTQPTLQPNTSSTSENISKRALKAGTSKKAMLKYKPPPTKLSFDDHGGAHEVYEMEDVDVDEGEGRSVWIERGKEYVDGMKDKLKADDMRDREEARERRREKKRIRKEKERERQVRSYCRFLHAYS